jgi:hypothetical protein
MLIGNAIRMNRECRGFLLPNLSAHHAAIANTEPMLRGIDLARQAQLRAKSDPPAQRFAHYLTRSLLRLGPLLFGTGILAAIGFAWSVRDEGYLTAETGIGYWLGIIGSIAMLLLVLYPLRKRFRILHGLGRVAHWFRIHMILGILGPTLIIFHCNFNAGSLNSSLALFTMLTVVASGIVGRYLYSKVHKGLYGSRAEIREILIDVEALKSRIGTDLTGHAAVFADITAFDARASQAPSNALSSLWAALTIGLSAGRTHRRIMRAADRALKITARHHGWSRQQRRKQLDGLHYHLKIYFAAVKKAQRFAMYERLFGLWHVLHMPLFVLLVLTVVIHIVAVHLY